MNQEINALQLVDLLENHERALAGLYQVYRDQFPDRDFWDHLLKDELVHAQWVETLYKLGVNQVFVNTEIFNQTGLKTSLEYVNQLIADAKGHTLINALALTLDLEKAMIEKKYFEVFETDSAEIKHIMGQLKEATEVHVDRVSQELTATKTGLEES